MLDCSTTKLPGIAAASSADWMPASGKSGKPVCGDTGSPIILPGLVPDFSCTVTYKNLPSGDHALGQTRPVPQISRGTPPPVGTAIVADVAVVVEAADMVTSGSGVSAINHRRSGEIFQNVLIGYGASLERPDPSLFIRPT